MLLHRYLTVPATARWQKKKKPARPQHLMSREISYPLAEHHKKLFDRRLKRSLKIPKGQSEPAYRRTDNTMAKRKST